MDRTRACVWVKELLKRTSAGSSCGCHFGSCSMRRTPFLSQFLFGRALNLNLNHSARLLSLKTWLLPFGIFPVALSLFPRGFTLAPFHIGPCGRGQWRCISASASASASATSSTSVWRRWRGVFRLGRGLICRLTIYSSSSVWDKLKMLSIRNISLGLKRLASFRPLLTCFGWPINAKLKHSVPANKRKNPVCFLGTVYL